MPMGRARRSRHCRCRRLAILDQIIASRLRPAVAYGPYDRAIPPTGSGGRVTGMVEEGSADARPVATGDRLCPWCSIDLGGDSPDRCPSCGAALVEDPAASVPGVTTVDPEAVRRAATWQRVRKRATLRGLLDGDRDEELDSGVRPSSLEALDPPSVQVLLEMQRLREELQAAATREALEQEAAAAPQAPEQEAAAAREALEPEAAAAPQAPEQEAAAAPNALELEALSGRLGEDDLSTRGGPFAAHETTEDDLSTRGGPFAAHETTESGTATKPEPASS